jgi:hypothetical protein
LSFNRLQFLAPAHDVRKEQVLIQQKLAQMAAMMSQNLPGLPMAGVPPGVWRGPMIPPGILLNI